MRVFPVLDFHSKDSSEDQARLAQSADGFVLRCWTLPGRLGIPLHSAPADPIHPVSLEQT